jgi:hypothetical protein
MTLELDRDECKMLEIALDREIQWLESELVHTDKHDLQRALATDLERVRALAARLGDAIARAA